MFLFAELGRSEWYNSELQTVLVSKPSTLLSWKKVNRYKLRSLWAWWESDEDKNSVALKFWFWNLKLNLNLMKRRIQFWPGSALSPIVYIIQDKEWRLSCSAVWSYKGKEWNVTMRIKLYQNCIRSRPKKHYLEKSAFDNNTLDCRLTEKNMWETRWHVTNLMHKDL